MMKQNTAKKTAFAKCN